MTVNKHFSSGKGIGRNSEQDLVESNIIELIQLAGQDLYYIKREEYNPDDFYQETPNSSFNSFTQIEMFVANVTDFGGQGDIMGKFGLEITDTADIVCARRRFTEETALEKPRAGDLIYFPLTRHLLEIDFVEDEPGTLAGLGQFYALSKLYCFQLKCSLFSPSYEDFDTGISQLDDSLETGVVNDAFDKSEEIEEEAKEVLDFEEDNLFGLTTERP